MNSKPDGPPLAVLNPGGRDPLVDYSSGPGTYHPQVHPPVNFHAYAASTRGAFCNSVDQVLEGERFQHCIVLIRRRLTPTLEAVRKLKEAGLTVWVAWKECSSFQIADQLQDLKLWDTYAQILKTADALVSPTLIPPPLPARSGDRDLLGIPTPYPVDFTDWDFSCHVAERRGIFVGTREFSVPSRNHLAAVTTAVRVALQLGTHVTVINGDKARGKRMLDILGRELPRDRFRVIDCELPYNEYLRQISWHRVVFQLDRSAVPGQVAGDALLCRSVCVGGNSAIEQIAFPNESHPTLAEADAEIHLETLMTNDEALKTSIANSQDRALRLLSFETVSQRIQTMMTTTVAV